jgi:hypothetical protein
LRCRPRFQELERREKERLGAVAPRARERAADPPVGQDLETLLAEWWAEEIVTELLDTDAIAGAHGAVGA